MADPIVSDADDKLRLPRTVSEAAALGGAFAVCFGLAFAISPLVENLSQVPEHLRGYINGLPLAALPVLNNTFKQMIARAMTPGAGVERTDLPSWPVAGAVAGGSLVAWYWFTAFLGKLTTTLTTGTILADRLGDTDGAAVTRFVEGAAGVNATVLTLLAAIVAGRMLNRFTRKGVLAALIVTSIAYLVVNFILAYYFNPGELNALMQDSVGGGAGAMAGMIVGFALIPLAIFLMGLIGVLSSRVNRERSMGRLVNAARPLDDDARHALTEEVLKRTAK